MDDAARAALRDWMADQRDGDGWQGWAIERVTMQGGRRSCAAVEQIAAEDADDDDDAVIDRACEIADDGHRYQIRRRQEGGGGPARSVRLRPAAGAARGASPAGAEAGTAKQADALGRVAIAGMEQTTGVLPLLMGMFEGISNMQSQQHTAVVHMLDRHHEAMREAAAREHQLQIELAEARASSADKLIDALLPVVAQVAPALIARFAPGGGGALPGGA